MRSDKQTKDTTALPDPLDLFLFSPTSGAPLPTLISHSFLVSGTVYSHR